MQRPINGAALSGVIEDYQSEQPEKNESNGHVLATDMPIQV